MADAAVRMVPRSLGTEDVPVLDRIVVHQGLICLFSPGVSLVPRFSRPSKFGYRMRILFIARVAELLDLLVFAGQIAYESNDLILLALRMKILLVQHQRESDDIFLIIAPMLK